MEVFYIDEEIREKINALLILINNSCRLVRTDKAIEIEEGNKTGLKIKASKECFLSGLQGSWDMSDAKQIVNKFSSDAPDKELAYYIMHRFMSIYQR